MRTVEESQFEFALGEIVHKPTGAHFHYRPGSLIFDSVEWRGEGLKINGFNKCDVWAGAQTILRTRSDRRPALAES
jgi:hypothetical protein